MTTIATFLTQGTLPLRWRQALLLATGRLLRRPTDPWEAAQRDAADDAAAVRALAYAYRQSDPGFASDLYAAADRHEREHEAARVTRPAEAQR